MDFKFTIFSGGEIFNLHFNKKSLATFLPGTGNGPGVDLINAAKSHAFVRNDFVRGNLCGCPVESPFLPILFQLFLQVFYFFSGCTSRHVEFLGS